MLFSGQQTAFDNITNDFFFMFLCCNSKLNFIILVNADMYSFLFIRLYC